MNVKLLLDENISPKVAQILCKEDGIDACHVRDRGGLGTHDHEVLDLAFEEERSPRDSFIPGDIREYHR